MSSLFSRPTGYNLLLTSIEEQSARQARFASSLKDLTGKIQAKAVSENVSRYDDIRYPNYALYDTPLELLYGDNLLNDSVLVLLLDV